MFGVDVLLYGGALMLCLALQGSYGQQLFPAPDHNPAMTGDPHTPSFIETRDIKNHILRHAPCFVDDIFASLREGMGSDGEVTNRSLALFGICTASDNSTSSVLSALAKETSRNQGNGLDVLQPTGVHLADEDESGSLKLTFDLPPSPLLKSNPVLVLAFESPVRAGDLDITFTSQLLEPNTQSVCITAEAQYIMLTGKAPEANVQQKWKISADSKSPDMKQVLKDALIGGKLGSNIPLLLFSSETGTDTRQTHLSGSSQASFFCELKRFLGDVLSQDHPDSPPLQLTSLQSLPPLPLGLSSSETLLAGLINSSALTIFSFTSLDSMFQAHHGELALSPALLEELRQRLEQTVMQIMEVINVEEVGQRAKERLQRLKELCAIQEKEPAAGESQYRAFLLLKALQTVARAYELQRGLRATRAGSSNPVGGATCALKSLTVSLEKYLLAPNTANINNCHGSCAFPMVDDIAINHVILLNFHTESGNVDERAPCCVPVAYEDLDVVEVNGRETLIRRRQNVVARKCGCR